MGQLEGMHACTCKLHLNNILSLVVPQIETCEVALSSPKPLDATQVTDIIVSSLKKISMKSGNPSDLKTSDSSNMPSSIVKLTDSTETTLKLNENTTEGSGLSSEHSKVIILGNNESTLSRQKSFPIL